jgi:CRP-like cAMP-binding protein
VLSPENQEVAILTENGYFGEIALITEAKRTASVQAISYCLLTSISRPAFVPFLEFFPEIEVEMKSRLVKLKNPMTKINLDKNLNKDF